MNEKLPADDAPIDGSANNRPSPAVPEGRLPSLQPVTTVEPVVQDRAYLEHEERMRREQLMEDEAMEAGSDAAELDDDEEEDADDADLFGDAPHPQRDLQMKPVRLQQQQQRIDAEEVEDNDDDAAGPKGFYTRGSANKRRSAADTLLQPDSPQEMEDDAEDEMDDQNGALDSETEREDDDLQDEQDGPPLPSHQVLRVDNPHRHQEEYEWQQQLDDTSNVIVEDEDKLDWVLEHSADNLTGAYTWKIPHYNFYRQQAKQNRQQRSTIKSPVFERCGARWRIMFFPNGNQPNQHMWSGGSVYIEMLEYVQPPAAAADKLAEPTEEEKQPQQDEKQDDTPTSPTAARPLQQSEQRQHKNYAFALAVVSRDAPAHHVIREGRHFFDPRDDRGFNEFFEFTQLQHLLHAPNDTLIIQALIEFPKAPAEYAHKLPGYDSKAATGYVGLKNQGATCFDTKTEVLVYVDEQTNGWMNAATVTKYWQCQQRRQQMLIASLNAVTNQMEYTPLIDVQQPFTYDSKYTTTQHPIRVQHPSLNLLLTPDHQVWAAPCLKSRHRRDKRSWRLLDADELLNTPAECDEADFDGWVIRTTAPVSGGNSASRLPQLSPELCAIVGTYLASPSSDAADTKVDHLPSWLWQLSCRQAQTIIHAMYHTVNKQHLPTSSPAFTVTAHTQQRADDLQRLCVHAGYTCTITASPSGNIWTLTINTKRSSGCVRVRLKHISRDTSPALRQRQFWCVQTAAPSRVVLVRRQSDNQSPQWQTAYVGNCYMNSLLQALYHIPEFRAAVYQMPLPAADYQQFTNQKPIKSISLALQRVFYHLQTSHTAVSTKQLTTSFGWDSLESFQQHDVQEFSRVLLDSLESTLKQSSEPSVDQQIFNKLFEGRSESYIECIHVNFKSAREEPYLDVSVNVKGCQTLQQSLDQYVAVEKLIGDNQYRAEGFAAKQDALKGTKFQTLPIVMQLQLKRFEYDPLRDQMTKVNDRFEFPTTIDMSKYLPPELIDADDPPIYHLQSVLVHSGSVSGGHYYSFIRPLTTEPPQASPWIRFDDDSVYRVSEEEAVTGAFGGKFEDRPTLQGVRHKTHSVKTANAYMLIYLRQSATVWHAQSAPNKLLAAAPVKPNGLHTTDNGDVEMKEAPNGEAGSLAVANSNDANPNATTVATNVPATAKPTSDQQADHPTHIDVPIPDTLRTWFEAEAEHNRKVNEEKRTAHLYTELVVINESTFYMQPIGVEFQLRQIDPQMLHAKYSMPSQRLRVRKDDTIGTYGKQLEELTGIPVQHQQYWQFQRRLNKTTRPDRLINAETNINTLADRDNTSMSPFNRSGPVYHLYIRDTRLTYDDNEDLKHLIPEPSPLTQQPPALEESSPQSSPLVPPLTAEPGSTPSSPLLPIIGPQPQAPPQSQLQSPSSTASSKPSEIMVVLKYYDVADQTLKIIGSTTIPLAATVRQLKARARQVLRARALIGPPHAIQLPPEDTAEMVEAAPSADVNQNGDSTSPKVASPATVSLTEEDIQRMAVQYYTRQRRLGALRPEDVQRGLTDDDWRYPLDAWDEALVMWLNRNKEIAPGQLDLLKDDLTLDECKLLTGDLIAFQVLQPRPRIDKARASHAQRRANWLLQQHDLRLAAAVTRHTATQSPTPMQQPNTVADNALPALQPSADAQEDFTAVDYVADKFYASAKQYYDYLRHRVVLELRQCPWPESPSATKHAPDAIYYHLEVDRRQTFDQLSNNVAAYLQSLVDDALLHQRPTPAGLPMLTVEPMRLRFHPTGGIFANRYNQPDTDRWYNLHVTVNLVLSENLWEEVLYYSFEEFTFEEQKLNHQLEVTFVNARVEPTEMKVLVPRDGTFADLQYAVYLKAMQMALIDGDALPPMPSPSPSPNNQSEESVNSAASSTPTNAVRQELESAQKVAMPHPSPAVVQALGSTKRNKPDSPDNPAAVPDPASDQPVERNLSSGGANTPNDVVVNRTMSPHMDDEHSKRRKLRDSDASDATAASPDDAAAAPHAAHQDEAGKQQAAVRAAARRVSAIDEDTSDESSGAVEQDADALLREYAVEHFYSTYYSNTNAFKIATPDIPIDKWIEFQRKQRPSWALRVDQKTQQMVDNPSLQKYIVCHFRELPGARKKVYKIIGLPFWEVTKHMEPVNDLRHRIARRLGYSSEREQGMRLANLARDMHTSDAPLEYFDEFPVEETYPDGQPLHRIIDEDLADNPESAYIGISDPLYKEKIVPRQSRNSRQTAIKIDVGG